MNAFCCSTHCSLQREGDQPRPGLLVSVDMFLLTG